MCGIILHNTSQQINVNSLLHRGPDAFGSLENVGHKYLHWRLSVIDTNDVSNQPMQDEEGNIITFNGEIYNHTELRKILETEGVVFNTESDTEVLMRWLLARGKQGINEVKGMFAFGLFVNKLKELWVFRDRLGIKPLYYYKYKDEWIFSSEIRSITDNSLDNFIIDSNNLREYFQFQTIQYPNTIVKNIKIIEPGQCVTICQTNEWKFEYYWKIQDIQQVHNIQKITKDKVQKEVRNLIEKAVHRRLVADVPLGSFLSGGIDSTAIVGIASKLRKKSLKTFTVAFDNPNFEDGRYSKRVAEDFQTDHHEVLLKTDDVLHWIPEALSAIDHPSADGINTWIVSKAAKESGLTVALSGLGGDELFGGYAGFGRLQRLNKLSSNFIWIPKSVKNLIIQSAFSSESIRNQKIRQAFQNSGKVSDSYFLTREYFTSNQLNEFFNPNDNKDGFENISQVFLSEILGGMPKTHLISQISLAELTSYTNNVLLRDTDVMSMAHALEVRVPFLDHELVEYVLALPDKFKRNVKFNKQLLIESLSDILPQYIIDRPKQGFVMPFENWMKNELRSFCEKQIKNLKEINVLNYEFIQEYWKSFQLGDPKTSWSRAWLFVVLGNWVANNKMNIENSNSH